MLDRRHTYRMRTLLGCRLSAKRLGPIGKGTVRDLSEAGARVILPPGALLPHTFDVVVSDAAPRRARLVWIRDGAAGLALTPADPPPGAAEVAPCAEVVRSSAEARPTRFEARLAAIAARPFGQRG